jgi:hypothetical protein
VKGSSLEESTTYRGDSTLGPPVDRFSGGLWEHGNSLLAELDLRANVEGLELIVGQVGELVDTQVERNLASGVKGVVLFVVLHVVGVGRRLSGFLLNRVCFAELGLQTQERESVCETGKCVKETRGWGFVDAVANCIGIVLGRREWGDCTKR